MFGKDAGRRKKSMIALGTITKMQNKVSAVIRSCMHYS